MKKLKLFYMIARALLGLKNDSNDAFTGIASTRKASISAKVIRANGLVQDLGVITKNANVY